LTPRRAASSWALSLNGDADAYSYGEIYAQWGDKAAALNRATAQSGPLISWMKVDWHLELIRNEAQFKANEARMNFPP
jgi:hypothetical protein